MISIHAFIEELDKLLAAGKITTAKKHEILKEAAIDFSQSARVCRVEPKK